MVRNIKFIISVFIGLVVFFILLNALEKTNNYSPNKILNKIETNFTARLLYKNKELCDRFAKNINFFGFLST